VIEMSEWTKEEDKILKKFYPVLGTKTIMFLKDRTIDSIEHRARRLDISYNPVGDGKCGFFDIETSGLQGDFNFMYSWYIKTANIEEYRHAAITAEEIRNGTLDRRIVQELIQALPEYKKIFGFYSTKFDMPMSRTRALYHGLDFVPYGLIIHKDVYYLAKRVLKIHSTRLESVSDLLQIKGKTHLDPRTWVMANAGNKEALDYIAEHNKADVILLEKVYKKLMEYEGRTRRFI
jgi:uncharacterized protein YprB with RNaseH-like and TPR domain